MEAGVSHESAVITALVDFFIFHHIEYPLRETVI